MSDSNLGFRSKQRICFCLDTNAVTCPMRKDRDCEEGILSVNFENLSDEELELMNSLETLRKTVQKEYIKAKAAATSFNQGMNEITKNIKQINLKKRK